MPLLHVDLCCGLGGWQAPFEDAANWRTVGLDIRRDVGPDVQADVRRLPLAACEPTLVTASPECAPYSSAWNAVKPPAVRYPDFELWNACVAAIAHLDPTYCVVENVAQAQYWHGPSDKHVGPYHFWGRFPPFDADPGERKTRLTADGSGAWVDDTGEAARIPYAVADALRRAVEWHL